MLYKLWCSSWIFATYSSIANWIHKIHAMGPDNNRTPTAVQTVASLIMTAHKHKLQLLMQLYLYNTGACDNARRDTRFRCGVLTLSERPPSQGAMPPASASTEDLPSSRYAAPIPCCGWLRAACSCSLPRDFRVSVCRQSAGCLCLSSPWIDIAAA
jgi:hypothetical protein